MQDGVPRQITKPVKKLLQDTFGADRVISRGFKNVWPLSSPDLNPCDFYLSAHLKDIIHRERHASVAELKSSVTKHVKCVTTEILNARVGLTLLLFQNIVVSGGSRIKQVMR